MHIYVFGTYILYSLLFYQGDTGRSGEPGQVGPPGSKVTNFGYIFFLLLYYAFAEQFCLGMQLLHVV